MPLLLRKSKNNSPDDLETITMWAEKSTRGADARSEKRPLHSTSQPTNTEGTVDVRTVISDADIAKIHKDAENAINKDVLFSKTSDTIADARQQVEETIQ